MQMDWIILIFCFILLFFLSMWTIGFFISNDFNVPNGSINEFKNILIIYPHADDEALTVGGIAGIAKGSKINTTLVILTKGEKGTPKAQLNGQLKEIRTKEAQKAVRILGINKLIQLDFGDGELSSKKEELTNYLDTLISIENPDLIITYDLSGLYGHPDHIAASEIITNLVKTKYSNKTLWYTTQPKRILKMIKLPEHMATDGNYKNLRVMPNIKIFVGQYSLNRIQAVYTHKSQKESFKSGLPVKHLPRWFFHSMPVFEYFYQVE